MSLCVAAVALSCIVGGCTSAKTERTRVEAPADNAHIAGADISALAFFERAGTSYRDENGRPGNAITILRNAGMNCFRLRLFVNPESGGITGNDLEYTIKLAKRVKASGAKLLLDIHYSDTWADPSHQTKPKTWKDLNFDALVLHTEGYTRAVMQCFIMANAVPDYVQLGNEVTNGMLWPEGRVEFAENGDAAAWDRFAALQHAAHRGLAAAFMGRAMPLVIMHIESTGNLDRTAWFIDAAATHGVEYDILGLSYYPQWHGTLADLARTLNFAAERSGKPVLVAETAYMWKKTADWSEGAKNLTWPATREGQIAFAKDVVAAVRNVPGGRGLGVVWWYPEAVLNPNLNVWLGGDCALFDNDARLLPAAKALSR